MVETIAPVVYGDRLRYGMAVGLHALAATATAALLGLMLGSLGALLGAPWGRTGMLTLGAVALGYALRELVGLPLPIPQRRGQVPRWWRTFYGPLVAATLYGGGLGAAFLTHVRHGTLVAASIGAHLSGEPILGAVLLAPFGAVRGLSVLIAATTDDETGPAERAASLADLARTRLPALVNGLALVALGGMALFLR